MLHVRSHLAPLDPLIRPFGPPSPRGGKGFPRADKSLLRTPSQRAASRRSDEMSYPPLMLQALKAQIERGKSELDRLRPLSTAALAQLQSITTSS